MEILKVEGLSSVFGAVTILVLLSTRWLLSEESTGLSRIECAGLIMCLLESSLDTPFILYL